MNSFTPCLNIKFFVWFKCIQKLQELCALSHGGDNFLIDCINKLTKDHYSYLTDSFEVTVNGTLIFSKLEDKKYPDLYQIVDEVVRVSEGEKPKYVTDKQCLTGPLAYLTLCFQTFIC